MSLGLTEVQIATVRAIAAEMIGEALRGADQRITDALSRETLGSLSDDQIRLECLKIAARVAGRNADPRPAAEALVQYVKRGLTTTATDQQVDS